MKRLIFSFIAITWCIFAYAQFPVIQWQKALGGSHSEAANYIQQTFDGGYIINGSTTSCDGQVTGHHGSCTNYDFWVVKLNDTGGIQWKHALGGSLDDQGWCVQQTADSGFIAAGGIESTDGDVICSSVAEWDYWLVKLSPSGSVIWNNCYGGSGYNMPYSVIQNPSLNYLVVGVTYSTDSPVTGNHGGADYWLIQTDATGSLMWEKCYGGSASDIGKCIQNSPEGGYLLAGSSSSNDFQVSGNHGLADYWVVRLDDTGGITWQKSLGGSGTDQAYSIKPTPDRGSIVVGYSNSTDGDVTGNHGGYDYWVVKLDVLGNISWEKSLGGSGNDLAYSVSITSDTGYIISGSSSSTDGDVTGNHGGNDCWVVKLNNSGDIQWQMSLGGSAEDDAYCIQQTSDTGFIVAGTTVSNDSEVSGNHGANDYWIVKLSQCHIPSPAVIRTGTTLSTSISYTTYQWEVAGVPIPGATNATYTITDSGLYSVVVADNIGCNGTSASFVVPPLAISSMHNNYVISVMPNPTTGQIYVSGVGRVRIDIYSTVGSLMKEVNNTTEISLADLLAGLYFIRLIDEYGEVIYWDKVVKL